MNPRNLFFVVASVIVMGASLMSQGLTDGVRVTLPHPVTIDDVVLEPGEYEIRRPSPNSNDQVLRFFNNDKLRYQTIAQTIPTTAGEEPPEQSKIILHHIGDKYYFDKIWIEGKTYGYEFPLPERVRALQKELAVTVPATLHSSQAGSGPVAVEQNVRVDSLAVPEPAPLVQDSQNREIPTRIEAEPAPEQVAVLQQEQRNTPPPSVDARQDSTQSTAPRSPAAVDTDRQADELPATASGWVLYVLSGGLFLILAAFMRPAQARG
jgi:hypothetical protein